MIKAACSLFNNNINEITADSICYSEEFYMKTNDYLFYFLQLKNLFMFILFPNNIKTENINEVKNILTQMKVQVEENKDI